MVGPEVDVVSVGYGAGSNGSSGPKAAGQLCTKRSLPLGHASQTLLPRLKLCCAVSDFIVREQKTKSASTEALGNHG